MIKLSVMYPHAEGARFDLEYYCTKHMAMVKELAGDALKGTVVEKGIAGGAPGQPPIYAYFGHLLFDSLEALGAAMGAVGPAAAADTPNYTDIVPTVQITEIVQ